MASFASLSADMKLNIQDFARKIKEATGMAAGFAKKLNATSVDKGLRNASMAASVLAAKFKGIPVSRLKELSKETWKWGLNLKSVSRVTSGIIISQVFYRMLQNIKSATRAVWEFTKELETAQVAYSNLFGDVSLATEFINVLKDFAAKTPFSFTEAEAAAKRLLAYGIEYKNVMYVMQGVLSAASIQGDSTKIEAISRALGQIYTYGKLMTQEVRQLSEAGIPAYEILQEELDLTAEQLANLGKEGIPAAEAINALVDGIQKRFGSAAEAASLTTTGIISNIKDNAVMLFSNLFIPFSDFLKSAFAELGQFLFYLRDISEVSGIGGVFEALFPEELHDILRQFAANFASVSLAVIRLVVALSGLLKPVLSAVIMLFNAFAPIISVAASTLAELVNAVTSNATAMRWLAGMLAAAGAMWVIYIAKATASFVITNVILGTAKALAVLRTMLNFVVAHPFWALLFVLGGVLVGISGGFSNLSNKVNSFFKSLTQFSGIDPDKVLLPSQKERANDLDKFNKRLSGTSDAMEDLADSTGKATKAAKGLLSFDEVFKLNQPDEGGKGIVDPGFGELLKDIEALGSAYMPELPDFSEYLGLLKTDFLSKFKDTWDDIKENMTPIIGSAIGGAFGALLGHIIGGRIGGSIGGVAGLLAGYFWGVLAEHFGLGPDQQVRAGIIGGIGAGLGAILGGIAGGPLGAKIGMAVGGLVGSFWGLLAEAFGIAPEQHIATLASGITGFFGKALASIIPQLTANLIPTYVDDVFVGFSRMVGFSLKDTLVSGIKGGVIGAITGLLTGVLSNLLTSWIANELDMAESDIKNSSIGQTIGSILGTIVGLFVGGPVGSIVGGVIGQLVGSLVGLFWDAFAKYFIIGVPASTGPIKEAFGLLFESLGSRLSDIFTTYIEPLVDSFGDATATIGDVVTTVQDAVQGAWDAISTRLEDIWNVVSTVLNDVWTAISTVRNDIIDAVSTASEQIWDVFSSVFYLVRDLTLAVLINIWNAFITWFNPIKDEVTRVVTEVWTAVSDWFTLIYSTIAQKVNEVYAIVTTVFSTIYAVISEIVKATWSTVSSWFTAIYSTVHEKISATLSAVNNKFSEIRLAVLLAVKAIWTTVSEWFSSTTTAIKEAVANWYTSITESIKNIYTEVTGWVTDMWNNGFGKLLSWIDTAIKSLRDLFNLGDKGNMNIRINEDGTVSYGHATGGIFNREHVAKFSEGNKAEAIIPLEEDRAMQPFVDAVANGLTASLAPILANMNSANNGYGAAQSQMQPLYVGTLIADDRSLRELERRMEVIRLQESRR